MRKILNQKFFNRDTKVVAQELLGKFLIRRIGNREVAAMITETEAYLGPHDLASHSSKGRTKRTEVMFGEAGRLYVYLCYGIHFMLNVVTREQGYPAAVLIRGVKEFEGLAPLEIARARSVKFLMGPGKVTKYFKIDKSLNAQIANQDSSLWFEDRGIAIKNSQIKKLPRVGINYAGPIWSKKKLRFKLYFNF